MGLGLLHVGGGEIVDWRLRSGWRFGIECFIKRRVLSFLPNGSTRIHAVHVFTVEVCDGRGTEHNVLVIRGLTENVQAAVIKRHLVGHNVLVVHALDIGLVDSAMEQ